MNEKKKTSLKLRKLTHTELVLKCEELHLNSDGTTRDLQKRLKTFYKCPQKLKPSDLANKKIYGIKFPYLPKELWAFILHYLTVPELCTLQIVAKPFYAICWQYQTSLDFRPLVTKLKEHKKEAKFETFQLLISRTGGLLQRLNLTNAFAKNLVAPEFIKTLTKRAPSLCSLKLKYCDLNFLSSQFSELSQLTNLRELHLGQRPGTRNRYLSYSMLTVLTSLSSLQSLNFNSALNPEDFSMAGLTELAPKLISLSLADNGIDTDHMQSFQVFTHLTKLNLSLNHSKSLQFLTNLTNLRILKIGSPALDDSAIDVIASLTSLTALDISNSDQLTHTALMQLRNFTWLRRLTVIAVSKLISNATLLHDLEFIPRIDLIITQS
jgi:hypothetical protein